MGQKLTAPESSDDEVVELTLSVSARPTTAVLKSSSGLPAGMPQAGAAGLAAHLAPHTASDLANSRHLLELRGMPRQRLVELLHLARMFRDRIGAAPVNLSEGPVGDELRGRVVGNLFFEDSTRTRVSFSVAAKRLGAEVIDLASAGSSASKGETVIDTAANVASMGVDALVIRHRSSGAAHMIAKALDGLVGSEGGGVLHKPCSVINAGDGRHEHPTQGLLDIFTVADAFGRLESFDLTGITIGIVGDIGSSRVARSGIAGFSALGARVVCIGPPSLVPSAIRTLGCETSHDLDAILPELDVINVLRIQFERHDVGTGATVAENQPAAKSSAAIASIREYTEFFGLTAARAERLKPKAIVMHPGPINRGVEIASSVADGKRSLILRQVHHGVAVRMAAMAMCIKA